MVTKLATPKTGMSSPVYVHSLELWLDEVLQAIANCLKVFSPTMDLDAPASISISNFDLLSSIVAKIGSEWLALKVCIKYSWR